MSSIKSTGTVLYCSDFRVQVLRNDAGSKSDRMHGHAKLAVRIATTTHANLHSVRRVSLHCFADARNPQVHSCIYHADNQRQKAIRNGGYVASDPTSLRFIYRSDSLIVFQA